jgi:hypothetical protein
VEGHAGDERLAVACPPDGCGPLDRVQVGDELRAGTECPLRMESDCNEQ